MSRDDQFMGFAKLLLKEMLAQRQWGGMDFNADDTEAVEEYSLIIARRAYDLAVHAVESLRDSDLDSDSLDRSMGYISDILIWPEEGRGER